MKTDNKRIDISEGQKISAEPSKSQTSDTLWYVSCFLITAIAGFLRFFWLELKPLHHDEGVNGFFLTTLFRSGVYKYDPANYHGPDLYYISLFFTKMFGLNTLSIRSSVAIFGVLSVVLIFFLKNYIGKIGSLFAALLLALSPGMVFISRYFIHEILFVFFSLAIVVAVVLFIEQRKAGIFSIVWMTLLLMICFVPSAINLANAIGGKNPETLWMYQLGFFLVEAVLVFFVVRMILAWDEGRPIYLILASASAMMLFATKETAFITLGTMLIAVGCVWLWQKIYVAAIDKLKPNELETVTLSWMNFREKLGDKINIILIVAAVSAIFIYVGVLFFTSFFTYAEGVQKALEAYAIWTKTGSKDHTQNGWLAYVKWGMKVESPILILSALGCLLAWAKARHSFAVFTAFWAFGMFAAYSIIPYKTPWLALSFLLPMCLIAGYFINELFRGSAAEKGIGAILAILATVTLSYQTYDANFVRYDDEEMPYVYAHTKRGFHDLIKQIEYYAEKSGKGKDATIEIVSPDYWSMPWYLNDYKNATFHGQLVEANTAEMIVAKKNDQDFEVEAKYSKHYKYVDAYPLRPGVDLMLLVRKDLAEANAKELYEITEQQIDSQSKTEK